MNASQYLNLGSLSNIVLSLPHTVVPFGPTTALGRDEGCLPSMQAAGMRLPKTLLS